MRKLAAILLLLVFWFNLFGYQALLGILEKQADHKLEMLIDQEDYKEEELIELRVSLNMPYQQRFTDFERYYGQVTLEGKTYNYVKRKIEGDILVLKCIPNDSKEQLKNMAAGITRSNSNSGNSPVKSAVKIFSFECDEATVLISDPGVTAGTSVFAAGQDHLLDTFTPAPYQPPRDLPVV